MSCQQPVEVWLLCSEKLMATCRCFRMLFFDFVKTLHKIQFDGLERTFYPNFIKQLSLTVFLVSILIGNTLQLIGLTWSYT